MLIYLNLQRTGLCRMNAWHIMGSGEFVSGNATIYINANRLYDRSAIEIGRTFLHESLHAYIHAYNNVSNLSYGETSLDESWNDYTKGSDQHEAMAIREINNIAAELERLHKQTTDYNRVWNMPDNKIYKEEERKLFYERLAWEGLESTDAYKNIDSSKKSKMEEMRKIEFSCGREWK